MATDTLLARNGFETLQKCGKKIEIIRMHTNSHVVESLSIFTASRYYRIQWNDYKIVVCQWLSTVDVQKKINETQAL